MQIDYRLSLQNDKFFDYLFNFVRRIKSDISFTVCKGCECVCVFVFVCLFSLSVCAYVFGMRGYIVYVKRDTIQ